MLFVSLLEKLDSDYFILISEFWLGVRIYWSLWHFSMVSDNESEFTDSKAEFTDSKASLNQFDSGRRISSQNFLIIFQKFNF